MEYRSPPVTPSKSSSQDVYMSRGTPTSSTPTSKGKGESLTGYVVCVSPVERSRRGNDYYLLKVQINKMEATTITVMFKSENPSREDFIQLIDEPVTFNRIYPGDGCFFYSGLKGSSHEKCYTKLAFPRKNPSSTVEHVQAQESGKFHLTVMIKWIGTVELSKKGDKYRVAMVADPTGDMRVRVWKPGWFNLKEDTAYWLTDLSVSDFFGITLGTTYTSCFQKLSGPLENVSWSSSTDNLLKADVAQSVDCTDLLSASLYSELICPKCHQGIPIVEDSTGEVPEFIRCPSADCSRLCKVKRCTFDINGNIDIEVDTNDSLTLSINSAVIDDVFGATTSKLYGLQLRELEKKLLRLEDISIEYNTNSKKVVKMVLKGEIEKKKSKAS